MTPRNLLLFSCSFLSTICTINAQNPCCRGPENVFIVKQCINGKNITGIQCERYYLMRPDGDQDNFTIDSYGNLVEEGVQPVESDRYCLGKLREDGEDFEVALVCFPEHDVVEESAVVYLFRAICALLSALFLIVTIIVYCLVSSLRDLQGKCLMHSIISLAIAMFLLCLMQFGITVPKPLCEIYGFFTFSAFIATFTWLNVIAFHIWRTTVIPSVLGTEKQWYMLYCIYAYGLPLILLLTGVIAHVAPGGHIKPGIGDFTCWFSDRKATWVYFYGPIAFLLLANIIFFIWTVKTLWKDMRECNDLAKLKSMKYKCLLYIKLFFIMGLSWIFEVISFGFQDQNSFISYVWLATDFINALQGVFIFLILVVFRKRALRGLANRGICCIRLPQQWKTLQDEECVESVEEARLAQHVPTDKVHKTKENPNVP